MAYRLPFWKVGVELFIAVAGGLLITASVPQAVHAQGGPVHGCCICQGSQFPKCDNATENGCATQQLSGGAQYSAPAIRSKFDVFRDKSD